MKIDLEDLKILGLALLSGWLFIQIIEITLN